MLIGRISMRARVETQPPGDRIASGKEQLGFLRTDRHHRNDRHDRSRSQF
jgi:hypothetical protein